MEKKPEKKTPENDVSSKPLSKPSRVMINVPTSDKSKGMYTEVTKDTDIKKKD